MRIYLLKQNKVRENSGENQGNASIYLLVRNLEVQVFGERYGGKLLHSKKSRPSFFVGKRKNKSRKMQSISKRTKRNSRDKEKINKNK